MNCYDHLFNINKHICHDSKVRTENTIVFKIIEKAINNAKKTNNFSEILNNAMYVAALIKLYQPFMDGNHRTALITFGNILNEKGYDFDYVKALDDMNNGKLNIPTIYEESDIVTFPSEWSEYISNPNVDKKGRKIS
ncbi:MAG: hypothetical protein IKN87_01650 [Bacilli bacterium]|nr:hypothetical protein [Bacilli bacterium]